MPIETKGRKSQTREQAAEALAKGTWEGTHELIVALAEESRYTYGWRPIRAAALAAVRDLEPAETGMSAGEWEIWDREAKALARYRKDGNPRDRIGVTPWQGREYGKNGAPKVVALACAHYLLGLPMPVAAGDSRALDDWFRPRFGSVERIAQWLQVSREWLSARLQGFEVTGGKRVERPPPAYLIRALDWVASVGPVCPYGEKPVVALWPGQDLEEGY